MNIGNIKINGIASLAPMAGVTDRSFREVCVEFGADLTFSEMISSNALVNNNKKTFKMLDFSDKERPIAIQLFGNDPIVIKEAAQIALKYNPDIIDINMGCPVPKIVSNGCGCALMKNPKQCAQIVKHVKDAVNVPVTVKIRKGWDNNNINCTEVAKMCEFYGADCITIHGRTKSQMYAPVADWDIIKEVKNCVNIPVIGNGDITSAESAMKMLDYTGCDMVMIGRATLGNPWIFRDINTIKNKNKNIPTVKVTERMHVMLKHIKLLCLYKGESAGIRGACKHISWYVKGLNGASEFRKKAFKLETINELYELINEINYKNT